MGILLFCLWAVLNGRLSLQVIISGLLLSVLFLFIMNRAAGYTLKSEKKLLYNTPLFALYILVLIREITKASLSVMRFCLKSEAKPDPVLLEFRSGLEGKFANVLLANSITLTPGTYTVFQEGDRFAVHCLCREFAEDFDDTVFIRLLRKMR